MFVFNLSSKLKSVTLCLIGVSLLVFSVVLRAKEATLGTSVQELKAEVLQLNRDLFILEEDLLYPASTAITLYISMDKSKYFKPDSVEIIIDDKLVTSHLYTEREIAALQRGGIQKVHQGNVKQGQHELVAIFIGQGPEGRDYKRALRHSFKHEGKSINLELKILDDHTKQQPEFSVIEWQK